MTVLVVGLSHRSAPVALLEQAALTGDRVPALLKSLTAAEPVAEAVVLATCNRLEVYAEVERFHPGVDAVTELLAEHTGLDAAGLTPHLYVHYEDRAVWHLLRVACGLDSMVIGEPQVLGQVRQALALAQEQATAGRVLNELVQRALRVGKRAHAETDLDEAGRSLVTVGLGPADQVFGTGGLTGRTALVVGAGSMSSLAATTLRRAGAGRILVANRTHERAVRLAEAVDGEAVRLGGDDGCQVPVAALAEADAVISCTGADTPVIGTAAVRAALADRAGRPLFVLDLALPRDVEQEVGALPGVTLVNLASLACDESGANSAEDSPELPGVAQVRDLVAAETAEFTGWLRATGVAPTVVALRDRAAEVVAAELTRLDGRLPGLEQPVREEVAQALHRVVDKLLHAPTVRVKELAQRPDGAAYAEALRELFDLAPLAAAVATPELEEGLPS